MSMSVNPLWFTYSLSLLDGSLDRDNETLFYEKMTDLFKYVEAKSGERSLSKSLYNEKKRAQMLKELFRLYHQHQSLADLCKSRFMRKLTKHNQENDENLKFIYETIVPAQVKIAKRPQIIYDDPAALLWLRELNATVGDPKTLAHQKRVLQDLPKEIEVKLSEGRGQIGKELMSAASKGWLDVEKLNIIIEEIKSEESIASEKETLLSEETVVKYFAQRYRSLIGSGGDYKKLYQNSLLFGLKNLKRDPIFKKG